MESYFAAQANRPLGISVRRTAEEMGRRTLLQFGDDENAIAAYRAVAEDGTEEPRRRQVAWLHVARVADVNGDNALFETAVSSLLAYGEQTEPAKIAREDWADRIAQFSAEPPSDDGGIAANPNPFNPSTTIRYQVHKAGMVTLSVYNVSGQLVRRLVQGERQPGAYAVTWDGRNAAGQPVATGVYLIRHSAPGGTAFTRRVTLLR